MGPLVWWWRWWLGLDPNQREQQLTDARSLLDEQQSEAEELHAQLLARNGRITKLQGQVGTLEQTREEAEQLRAQVTELEGARDEADQLRAQITELEGARDEADQLRAQITELETAVADADKLRAEADQLRAEIDKLQGEIDKLHGEITELQAELEQARDDSRQAGEEAEKLRAQLAERPEEPQATSATADGSTADLDLDDARQVLGTRIRVDDLTVIDGIGPKIAELFADAGISTWRALADAEDERLREVLASAGPRYRSYDPSSWSRQATLLADGRWQDFKDATVD